MKRTLKIPTLVLLATLLFVLPVAAKGNGNVKGEVSAFDAAGGAIILLSNKGETLIINVPDGYDFSTLEVGDSLLVRGELVGEGTINASTIKEVGGGDDQEEAEAEAEVESEGEGSLADNSAFCAEDKQDKHHPMAVSIAETYGVSEEEVIGYFCEGYGFGAVMLALQTSEAGGGDAASILAARSGGKGWGQIWKELNLVGKDREGASPPGQSNSNRPEETGNDKPKNTNAGGNDKDKDDVSDSSESEGSEPSE